MPTLLMMHMHTNPVADTVQDMINVFTMRWVVVVVVIVKGQLLPME
jgi:hypothetical protein